MGDSSAGGATPGTAADRRAARRRVLWHADPVGTDHLAAPDGAETLVASADEYLPGAVDGWTWAVGLITDAARDHRPEPAVDAAAQVGSLVAELHAALAGTVTVASRKDTAQWRDTAFEALETVCTLPDSASVAVARARRDEIETILGGLDTLAGTPVIEGHGDLHVGQVLRSRDGFVVTDFDGNPVLPAPQRMLPIPAALDVAGMAQSLAHAAIVAGKHTHLDTAVLAEVDTLAGTAFLGAYADRIAQLGHADLYDPARFMRSGRNRSCARSSTRQGICPAGCMCPTQPYPLSSTKGCRR